jgi:hypothetical protein
MLGSAIGWFRACCGLGDCYLTSMARHYEKLSSCKRMSVTISVGVQGASRE